MSCNSSRRRALHQAACKHRLQTSNSSSAKTAQTRPVESDALAGQVTLVRKRKRVQNTTVAPLLLAAQCEIPPHIAQYPFEIVSQRGVSHAMPFCLVFIGYRAGSSDIPLLWGWWGGVGVSHLHFACSLRGNAQKRGRGYHTQLAMLKAPKTPQRTIGGYP